MSPYLSSGFLRITPRVLNHPKRFARDISPEGQGLTLARRQGQQTQQHHELHSLS